ncbi:hypothetical protein AK830_g4231 [Neonectria ditissima]|uniref:Uncharacterized protein n=1 Tax=Neonectria ditissima TaxID=78410 RepID=A0A0P7BGJ9_9HYPO|nr:hypothetical protein AK830_g4231 [Neonectria ditissima]
MALRLLHSLLFTAIIGSLGAVAGPCLPPIDNERPIRGGDFEDGKNPFTYSSDSKVRGSIVDGGYESDKKFYSFTMIDNKLLEMYQDIRTLPGTKYRCTYYWYFDTYYETLYDDGYYYVPYIRIYQNDDTEAIGNRYPTGPQQTGGWLDGHFDFTSSATGLDRIWFDAASPQPIDGEDGGRNNLSLDQISCQIR